MPQAALGKNVAQRATLESRAEDFAARKKRLKPQRTIRQLDVNQDIILTAVKLTAAQLISFVLREYLPSMPMTPQTFVQRVHTTTSSSSSTKIHATRSSTKLFAKPASASPSGIFTVVVGSSDSQSSHYPRRSTGSADLILASPL
jgi:hypothetical protein